jgi:DNA-binding MarR family transcriptional regulator
VLIGLTPAGLETAERAGAHYREERVRLLAPLSDAEIEQLDDAVIRLLAVVSEEAQARA